MGNVGRVVRVGATVRRPSGSHHPAIATLLTGLTATGFPAPEPLGHDDQGRAAFRWIEGAVPVPPYPAWSLTEEALASVGRLLRRYHDAVSTIPIASGLDWSFELRDPHGGPIVCHNDVCPANVIFRDGHASALIDFDFAAPGRPVWDLALTARMWIPLRPPEFNGTRAHLDPFRRLPVLVDAYGLEADRHKEFVDAIVECRRIGSAFVQRRIAAGETVFLDAWKRHGGADGDAAILRWLEHNTAAFLECLGN
jgi:hypothetical protein